MYFPVLQNILSQNILSPHYYILTTTKFHFLSLYLFKKRKHDKTKRKYQ